MLTVKVTSRHCAGLAKAQAHWIGPRTGGLAGASLPARHRPGDRSLPAARVPDRRRWRSPPRRVTGGATVPLTYDPAGLTAAQSARFARSSGVPRPAPSTRGDRAGARELLRGQVVVATYDGAGTLLAPRACRSPACWTTCTPRGAAAARSASTWQDGSPVARALGPDGAGRRAARWPAGRRHHASQRQGAEQREPRRRLDRRRPSRGRRALPVRGDGVRADDRQGRGQRGHRPVLGRAHAELDPVGAVDLTDTAPTAARLGRARSRRSCSPWTRRSTSCTSGTSRSTTPRVPAAHRGTYLAFADDGDGTQAPAGPREGGPRHGPPAARRSTSPPSRRTRPSGAPRLRPAGVVPGGPPTHQQACVSAVAEKDGFNWGYDPLHYTTPEGSYAVATRTAAAAWPSSARWSGRSPGRPAGRDGPGVQPHGGERARPDSRSSTAWCPATTSG